MRRCKECGVGQPEEAFSIVLIRGNKVYRRHQCNRCKRAYKMARETAVLEWLRDQKKKSCCALCGFADYRALAFHHKDRLTKEFNVSEMPRLGFGLDAIRSEIAKCIVLCLNCHQIEHYQERQAGLVWPTRPWVKEPPGSEGSLLGARKVCRYCFVEQDESNFEICKVLDGRAYRRHKCRACKRGTQKLRRERLIAWIEAFKKASRCEACGFDDFRALEFHHLDGEDKDYAIGEMAKDNRSIQAVQREIAKCVVLCANCHRIEHYRELELALV